MSKEKRNSALMRPVQVSAALARVVGNGPIPRTEVTKKLWEYIKKHNLQDKKNKRLIHPDAALKEVFESSEAIDMFAMAKVISKHLKDPQLAQAR